MRMSPSPHENMRELHGLTSKKGCGELMGGVLGFLFIISYLCGIFKSDLGFVIHIGQS